MVRIAVRSIAMAVDHIRYDLLAQKALRGVVRSVLADAAKHGLPGEHHFYIAFNTHAQGVRISARLREQYPQEITIVLQHQFWDLMVSEEGFEVGLSFGGIPEKIAVPFEAIKGFFDPAVQFGLQFEVDPADSPPHSGEAPKGSSEPAPPALPRSRRNKSATTVPTVAQQPATSENSSENLPKPTGGGEIVRLDRFRKK